MKNQKLYNYWTKEKCFEEALKYDSRNVFRIKSNGAYDAANRNNWLFECCKHMKLIIKPKNYWTKEKCFEEALKYETIKEFYKNGLSAYSAAHKNGWLKEITKHIVRLIKPNGYWTKKRCAIEAKKYNTRVDFFHGSKTAYKVARINGWLDEMCNEMFRIGNNKKRLIYAYIFSDNSVYVELTDYIDESLASIKEGEFLEEYKKLGYKILNKRKTGTLGGYRSKLVDVYSI